MKNVRQAQKLESIGRLAGGVAHDFNNLLTVILGYARAMKNQIEGDRAKNETCGFLLSSLNEVVQAAERASGLTRQLLAFSRRQESQPETFNLADLVSSMKELMMPLIGGNIDVTMTLGEEPGYIHADPSQLEQVIANLIVNSRDAMPEGGHLIIESRPLEIADEFQSAVLSAPLGHYVLLRISDTGTGMTPEVKARAFDPFFTTKPQGKGTGLGLATVYGIVQQNHGYIDLHSTQGLGTAVRILLPAAKAPEGTKPAPAPSAQHRGSETILLVEDEAGVRRFVRDILREHGYRVLDAATGEEAVEIARNYRGPLHLMLSDVVLPGITGIEAAKHVRELRRGITVLLMSGYPDRQGKQIYTEGTIIEKPFTEEVLLERIGSALRAATKSTEN